VWFDQTDRLTRWDEAARHLARADPVLGRVIKRVGPCTLAPRRDYFVVLCKAIFTQQISTTVAAVLFGRFRDLFPMRRPTPGLVLEALKTRPAEVIRHCGLSRQKAEYVRDLAQHFVDGRIPTRRLASMDDEAVIEALVNVKGIGRWTAEMFLIFTLNRPDVLPVDDLGLQEGVREIYGLGDRVKGKVLAGRCEDWRPWRTVATWYVWRRGASPERPVADPRPTRNRLRPTPRPTRD
jgi:DNA-3-methyladenine glycosylase II